MRPLNLGRSVPLRGTFFAGPLSLRQLPCSCLAPHSSLGTFFSLQQPAVAKESFMLQELGYSRMISAVFTCSGEMVSKNSTTITKPITEESYELSNWG